MAKNKQTKKDYAKKTQIGKCIKKIDLTIRVFRSKNEMNFSVILKNDTNSFLR